MGLTAQQRQFYADNGYLFLERAIAQEDVDALRAGRTVRSVYGSHTTGEVFGCLVRHPALLGPARELLGGDVHVYQFKINAKAAIRGDLWEWHQDFIFWHHEDGMPAPHVATFCVLLDEVTEFNGPLIVIPGSHREGMIDVQLWQRGPPLHAVRQVGLPLPGRPTPSCTAPTGSGAESSVARPSPAG